ncbi:hypothetical protein E5D57_001718 [Metarhizium anisopliae]|nr:hypothetical protein E5D57_001718 [Metarhizium anisopliae]
MTPHDPGVAVTVQLPASSPNDAMSFLQGLYPPTRGEKALVDGSKIGAALGGYRYVPFGAVASSIMSNDADNISW